MRSPLLLACILLGPACSSGEAPDAAPPGGSTEGSAEESADGEQLIDVPSEVVLPEHLAEETDEVEEPPTGDAEEPRPLGQFLAQGSLDHKRFEDGELILRFEADEVRTASEGILDLTGVRIELVGHGVILAETGRVRFRSTGGRLVLGGPEDRVELEVARIDLNADHALAPMSLTAGALVVGLEEERLELSPGPTASRPHLDGARMQLFADDLVVELAGERLTAEGRTHLELLDEDGAVAHGLDADRLTLEKPSEDQLELDATGAPAQLVVHGEPGEGRGEGEDLGLTAPRMVLGALQTGEEELALTSLVVHGSGRVERAGSVARGDDLEFDFAPDGEAGRVVLFGAPELRFAEGPGGTDELTLSAEGPLGLTLEGELAFDTEAAAEVRWSSWRLTSAGGLSGVAEETAGRVRLDGKGGVVLEGELGEVAERAGSLRFESREVRLDHRFAVDPITVDPVTGEATDDAGPDWPKVNLVGSGQTTVVALTPEGAEAQVACTDGMELDLVGERWTLPSGRGVTLRLADERGTYAARADELLDLDPEALRMDARGSVSFEQLTGDLRRVGRGGRLHMTGEDLLELEGSADQRARYEEGASWVEANRLERVGRRVTASGRVATHLELELMSLDLECGLLELTGLDPEAGELDSLERLEIARGVRGTVVMGPERLDLAAEELLALRVDEQVELPDGRGAPALYELFGQGPVSLEWTTAEADWRVDCRSLEAYLQEAPPAEATDRAWFELVAKGEVRVRELVGGFVGQGETLHLDHAEIDRALLDGDGSPAQVSGRLPEVISAGPVSYHGEVDLLTLAGGQVEADGVDIVLTGLDLPGSRLTPDGADSSSWRVLADHLHAEMGLVELEGQVRFEGSDDGVPMRLKAGLVTFVNTDLWIAAQAEGVGPGGGRVEPQDITGTGVTAHGDVTLRRGAEYELRGDELSVAADTRELRVAGNPARAVYASLLAEGRWLRFDPITMTVNAGPGRITVDPVLARALQGARGAEDQP